jgi:hypothetical protein
MFVCILSLLFIYEKINELVILHFFIQLRKKGAVVGFESVYFAKYHSQRF